MASKTIETRARTTKDGRLNLNVDVDIPDAEVAVVVTVTPVPAGSSVDANGWPEGFFDRVAGSMPMPSAGWARWHTTHKITSKRSTITSRKRKRPVIRKR